MRYKSAKIILVNGDYEWIDPVIPEEVEETDTSYIFDNGYYKYEFNKVDVLNIEYSDYSVEI